MTTLRITPENASEFLGSDVRFYYGAAGMGEDTGTVVDFETNRWGTHLVAKIKDGSLKTISSFTDIGIGCYLVKKAEPKVNTKSPWYRPE